MVSFKDIWESLFTSKSEKKVKEVEQQTLLYAEKIAQEALYQLEQERLEESYYYSPNSNIFPTRDRDDDQFIPIGESEISVNPTEQELKRFRMIARSLFKFNPHAKNIVRNLVRFIVGRGMILQATMIRVPEGVIIPDVAVEMVKPGQRSNVRTAGRTRTQQHAPDTGATPEEQRLVDACNFYWNLFVKRNSFKRKLKEIVRRIYRDGEVFIRFFPSDDTLLIRFIDPDHVTDHGQDGREKYSYGIETDPDDVETPVSYWVDQSGSGQSQSIPASEIQHIKIGDIDSDVKRGEPIYVVVQRRLKQYDTWIQDRIGLNKIRSSVAILRLHTAGSSQVRNFVEEQKTRTDVASSGRDPGSEDIRRKRIYPGTIIDAPKGTEYKFLSPDVQANDVRHDGRSIMLSIASGVGQPEYMVTSDASNANYSSTMVAESPAVKEFEDGQELVEEELEKIWYRLRDYLITQQLLPQEAKTVGVTIQSSRIIARDKLKDTQANEILCLNRVISPQIWCAREGVSFEQVQDDWRIYGETNEQGLEGHNPESNGGGSSSSRFGFEGDDQDPTE